MNSNGKIGCRGEYKPTYTVQGERVSPFGAYSEISLGGDFYALLSMRAYHSEDVKALRNEVKWMHNAETGDDIPPPASDIIKEAIAEAQREGQEDELVTTTDEAGNDS